jgi:A/G-specific adenine glycosylase
MPTVLPIKAAAPKIEKIARGVAIIESNGDVLVRKNAVDGLMGDLWEFPYYDRIVSLVEIRKKLTHLLGKQPIFLQRLEKVEHSFTRFIAQLFPYKFQLTERGPVEGFSWVAANELERLPFSAGHRKLVKQLYTQRDSKLGRQDA